MQTLGLVRISKTTKFTLLETEGVLAKTNLQRVEIGIGWELTGWEMNQGKNLPGGK